MYPPQHGHGRDSIAAVSYTDQLPTRVQRYSQLPHVTVHVFTTAPVS
ncbi:MAG: hypothetical protein U0871_27540 [Gemmataceae bacterium]